MSDETTIIEVPLHQLHDSPLQYRKTYQQATIDEIAASIRDTGRIHQPLVVRLRYPNPLFRDQYDPQDGYEIVFGHTRRRGAEQAGLATAPCIVRTLTDSQVRAAQAAENIARADVHPIEEAQGFQAMIDSDNVTADMLAEQLGKSRSYVYGRLKLLALCPEVRKACLAGEIGTEVGLLIARLRTTKLQEKALARIKSKYYDLGDGGKKSFRNIRDLLNEHFTLDLKSAFFDIEDEMLLPAAGHCLRCPKRSGNAPEFEDVAKGNQKEGHYYQAGYLRHAGADVCTDPDCFEEKKKAHLAREALKLEQQGNTVIAGNRARAAIGADGQVKGGYVPFSAVPKECTGLLASSRDAVVHPIVIQDPRTGKTVKAARLEDVKASAEKLQVRLPDPKPAARHDSWNSPEARAAREAEAKRNRERMEKERTKRRALLDDVRSAAHAVPRSTFDLQLVAEIALAGVDFQDKALLGELWGCNTVPQLEKRLGSMGADEAARFVLDCALVGNVSVLQPYKLNEQPRALLRAAKHYGVDRASTPSTAARAPGKAAAKAKNPSAAPAPDEVQAGLPLEPGEDAADASGADREQMDDAGCAGGAGAEAGQVAEVAQ